MCLDFHPQSPALLAVGLYDGTVLVYDVRNKHKKPIYQSNVRTQKHTDPVWQVRWNEDISKNFNFFSISSDGRVMNWSLMKNKLEPEEVIKLKLVGSTLNCYVESEEESSFIGLACGLCFDFNKFDKFSFLVGT
jgi:dynein intermediate chain 1